MVTIGAFANQPSFIIMQPVLPLGLTGWDTLPTSKVRRPGPRSPFRWAHSYTGFSLEFALAALTALGAGEGSAVLDPFLGSGTTLVAAADLKCTGLGVEINPFSALLARTRLSSRVDADRVMALLSPRTSSDSQKGADVLGAENAAYVSSVIKSLTKLSHIGPAELWMRLFEDSNTENDTYTAVLLSLTLGARESARLVKGSNPVWLRAPSKGERTNAINLKSSALEWAERICKDLDSTRRSNSKKFRIAVEDIAKTKIPNGRFDLCLTSPPYLNRLDYVTASLPELTVLQLVAPFSLEALRRSTIGTTRVVSKFAHNAPNEVGSIAFEVLQKIRSHRSHASERYYYHIFANYFVTLFAALKRIRSYMSERGKGIIVLQDSFYKDLNVATPSICVEMLRSLSCEAQVVRTQPVRTHMGRMNPQQNAYVAHKELTESLVYFSSAQ